MSERENFSGFVEFTDLTEPFKKWRFDAYRQETKRDFGHHYVESDLNNTDDPGIPFTTGGSHDDNMAFSLGLVHQATSNLTLCANYSQGDRHPHLVERYTGAPAHGSTEAKDYITTDATRHINVGGAETCGAELELAYELGDSRFTPYASLTYLLDEALHISESTPASLEVYAGIYNIFDKNYTPFDELQAAGRYAVVA